MSMYKTASDELTIYADDHEEVVLSLPMEVMPQGQEVVLVMEPQFDNQETSSISVPEEEGCTAIRLSHLPGAEDDVIQITDDGEEEEAEKEEKEKKDKSKANDGPKDLSWLKDYVDNIPKHRGENLGLERAKSYLLRGINMLSKAIQEDHEGVIDIAKAEDARIEMESGVERLEKELNKRKKKADVQSEQLTKEGQKIPVVGGIIVTVPLKISRIARVCINGSVSGGKDIEDLMKRQSEKWKLSEDEKADLVQHIEDLGFIVRRDRGFLIDDKDPYKMTSVNNFDFPANYSA